MSITQGVEGRWVCDIGKGTPVYSADAVAALLAYTRELEAQSEENEATPKEQEES